MVEITKGGLERSGETMALRRIAARLLISLLAAAVGLLVAEVALRIVGYPPEWSSVAAVADENGTIEKPWHEVFVRRSDHPLLDYELIPGRTTVLCYPPPWPDYFDRQGRVAHRVNRLGLRDVEFALKPRNGTHRILCLGDSFTVGFGVPLECSFPKQLERLLGERHPGRVFQVVNAGFAAGPEIRGHVAFLFARGLSFQPRTVILTVCLNDVADVPMAVECLTWTHVPGATRFRLARLLSNALTGLRARWLAGDPERCDALCPPRDAIASWRESLEIGAEICRDRGLRFLVVVYPMMCDFEAGYPWIRIHERVVAHCRAKGIDVEDLLPAFGGRNGRALWVHPTDQHPNPVAHAIAARAILAALERRGWVP